jgi:hypothetical protein
MNLRDIVWTAIAAVAMGIVSVATAVFGCSLEISTSVGVLGLIFAVLTPKS